ncbi:polar amino acid transport system substrate-binding protein [Bradyrhizobium japonicum]
MKRLLVAAALFGAMTVSALAIELPPEIAKRGSLKVALVPNYPPMEFRDPATNALSGFDIDLGEAIGRKLGVKIEWQETSFAEFMPSISTGRVDAILSGFTDYASRHDIASFVDSGAARSSSCSSRARRSSRTRHRSAARRWAPAVAPCSRRRSRRGARRIAAAIRSSSSVPTARPTPAPSSGIMDLEPGAYASVGEPIAQQFTGIALPVKEKALQQAILEAVDGLIADGTYKTLLAKWKLNDNGLEKATINAGQ